LDKEIAEYEKFNKDDQVWRSAQKFETPNAVSFLAEKFWRDHSEKWPILSQIAQKVADFIKLIINCFSSSPL
jgi:iron-sulfur cluster repair protein YtfE (RIC family)